MAPTVAAHSGGWGTGTHQWKASSTAPPGGGGALLSLLINALRMAHNPPPTIPKGVRALQCHRLQPSHSPFPAFFSVSAPMARQQPPLPPPPLSKWPSLCSPKCDDGVGFRLRGRRKWRNDAKMCHPSQSTLHIRLMAS
jgi:hypothetical protein